METLKDRIVCASVYADASQYSQLASHATVPTIYHLTGASETKRSQAPGSKIYEYGSAQQCTFAVPFYKDFHYATEAVSHSRNLSFFKPLMGGPYFDLELLWDEHTYYEFAARDVENTMATMVQEPYVNHIPTVSCEDVANDVAANQLYRLPAALAERSSRRSTAIILSSATHKMLSSSSLAALWVSIE